MDLPIACTQGPKLPLEILVHIVESVRCFRDLVALSHTNREWRTAFACVSRLVIEPEIIPLTVVKPFLRLPRLREIKGLTIATTTSGIRVSRSFEVLSFRVDDVKVVRKLPIALCWVPRINIVSKSVNRVCLRGGNTYDMDGWWCHPELGGIGPIGENFSRLMERSTLSIDPEDPTSPLLRDRLVLWKNGVTPCRQGLACLLVLHAYLRERKPWDTLPKELPEAMDMDGIKAIPTDFFSRCDEERETIRSAIKKNYEILTEDEAREVFGRFTRNLRTILAFWK